MGQIRRLGTCYDPCGADWCTLGGQLSISRSIDADTNRARGHGDRYLDRHPLVTLTATNTEFRTETVTSTTTAPPAPTYEVWGRVTLADFTTPLTIIFSSDAEPDRVFQINNRMYAGTLTNSVAYAVNVTWYSDADPLRTPNSSGCGTFNQTVGAGSSAIRMDWAC